MEWKDGLASGGSSMGAVRPPRQEQAARLALLWAAGPRRPEVEEALRPLDGHRTVTAARIVYIDEVDKALGTRPLSRPTGQLPKWCAPDVRGGIIFWAGEARISEIEEEARHPLDGHPTATGARTV